MNMNVVGAIGAAVILAIVVLFHPTKKPTPASEPAPPAIEQVDSKQPDTKQPDAKPIKQAPVPKTPKQPGKVPAKVDPSKTVYHRVTQGGKRGGEVACGSVKSFAEGKSSAEVAALAKQYNASVDEVKRWYVCIN